MKIVVNSFSARQGGGKTYLKNILAHVPKGVEIDIEVFADRTFEFEEKPNIKRVFTSWPTQNPFLRSIWEILVLPHYLRSVGADVLFCPGGLVLTPAPEGCRVVTMFRNMIPFDQATLGKLPVGFQWFRNLLLRRYFLRSLAGADLSIFISDWSRKIIESLVFVPRSFTIWHGVPLHFRRTDIALPAPNFLSGKKYFLYVSKTDIYKHHLQVVEAYSFLSSEIRDSYLLILIGDNNNPEGRRVKKMVNDLGLSTYVHFLGDVPYDELPNFYHNASVNIFASSCENCPNILLEMLAAGRPVLSSNIDPMPEFGGDDVLYFSPFDSKSLFDSLNSVIFDKALSARLSESALRRSLQFDWVRTATRTWSAISEL